MTCAAAYIEAAMYADTYDGPTQTGPESSAARAFLQYIDRSESDGKAGCRRDRFLDGSSESEVSFTPEELLEDEEVLYNLWRISRAFVPEDSDVPDKLIAVLCKITSDTKDERGRTFWRVRRLKDDDTPREASSTDDGSSNSVEEYRSQEAGIADPDDGRTGRASPSGAPHIAI